MHLTIRKDPKEKPVILAILWLAFLEQISVLSIRTSSHSRIYLVTVMPTEAGQVQCSIEDL